MNDTVLDALHKRALECDRHHHFYHYKSSWQHLGYAEQLRAAGDMAGAKKHYEAAVFQDHLNAQAKAALRGEFTMPRYDTHLTTNALEALAAFEASLGWEPDTSAELCAEGKWAEALKISSARHDRYHQHASNTRYERGQYFVKQSELDLAIADFSKALDLNEKNMDALKARAALYEFKENFKMAEDDKLKLASIG